MKSSTIATANTPQQVPRLPPLPAAVSCCLSFNCCSPVSQGTHGEVQVLQGTSLAREQPVTELTRLSGRHTITLHSTGEPMAT